MNNTLIALFGGIMIVILIFLYDLKYIEIRILAENYPEFIELQKQYDEYIKTEKGAPCEIIKNKLDIMNAKKPSVISSFFIWVCDGISTIFNSLSPKNFGLLIVLIFAIRLFMKY